MTRLEFNEILNELNINDLVADDYGIDLYRYNDMYLYFDGDSNAYITSKPGIEDKKIKSKEELIWLLVPENRMNKVLRNVTKNMLNKVNSKKVKEYKDENIKIRDELNEFDASANPLKYKNVRITDDLLSRVNIECDDKKGSISTIVYDENTKLKYTSYPGNSFSYQIDYTDGDIKYLLEHYVYEGKEKFYIGKKGPERHLREITFNLSDMTMTDSKYNKTSPIISLDYELIKKRMKESEEKSKTLITGIYGNDKKAGIIL